MAQKGTLFLDEIGELSLPTQAKLLRVLEEREIMKVGSGELIRVDVRIIAATNRDLNALVDCGTFRLDLYYRLNTLIINVPPLRSRRSDIPLLIQEFLLHEGKEKMEMEPAVRAFLMDYPWKGNIRELRNCVEYMANLSDGPITADHLPDYIRETYESSRSSQALLHKRVGELTQYDREAITNILILLKRKPAGSARTPPGAFRRGALHDRIPPAGAFELFESERLRGLRPRKGRLLPVQIRRAAPLPAAAEVIDKTAASHVDVGGRRFIVTAVPAWR